VVSMVACAELSEAIFIAVCLLEAYEVAPFRRRNR